MLAFPGERLTLSAVTAQADLRRGDTAATPPAPVTDQLVRLGELARQGLLTPEEFAAATAALLGA
ncbi:hypothetical protein ACIP8Z_06820 [Streptomyces sp. NPDC088553]|uniref:hypothetical protein n=1 Tax=Streptomyces sp. NPDC088553 TaxID=3365864 RepID=UPI003804006A